MEENVNGAETTLEEIMGEMGAETRSAGPEGAGGFRLANGIVPDSSPACFAHRAQQAPVPPEPPLDSPSPLEPTRAAALDPGLGAEDGEKANPEADAGKDAPGDRKAELTRGLTALAEDGWTAEELTAFSQDEQAARDIAEGRSLESAALRYMRRARAGGNESKAASTPAKRSVPTMRSAGAGETDAGDPIARMSDKEFDAFYARAMEKAMTGAKVRI